MADQRALAHCYPEGTKTELERLALGPEPDPAIRAQRLKHMREHLLTGSQNIGKDHIDRIGTADLRLVFLLLDEVYFNGLCLRAIDQPCHGTR